ISELYRYKPSEMVVMKNHEMVDRTITLNGVSACAAASTKSGIEPSRNDTANHALRPVLSMKKAQASAATTPMTGVTMVYCSACCTGSLNTVRYTVGSQPAMP